jgi:hypothetical protein
MFGSAPELLRVDEGKCMLLQTNSYIVPKEKRAEHSRLIRRFRQTLLRLGCDHFEVYEQVGSNWSNSESAGRYVQILRFLDRKHQLAVQAAERSDPTAQAVIADFCDLINFPYQQQQGLFAVGFYTSVLPVAPKRGARGELVSTVEHEVIDDPEAEKPYPGASDGPPIDEATGATEAVVVEGQTPFEPSVVIEMPSDGRDPEEVFSSEPIPHQTVVTEAVEQEEVLEAKVGHEEPPIEVHTGETGARAKVADDFMDLVGGELDTESDGIHEKELPNPFDEESEDDSAHGFIEVVDETDGHSNTQSVEGSAEPAHQHAKDRPPGW